MSNAESTQAPPQNGAEAAGGEQVVVRQPKPLSKRDPFAIAKAVAGSRYFPDTDTVEKAVVKIIAGEAIGLDPITAVQGITVIEGKIGYTGNLVATLVQQHAVYAYRVKDKTNQRCEIEFGPAPAPGRDADGEWLPWPGAYGTSEFTIEDAKRAELVKPRSNWAKYPRAMCFNRALTEGVRTFIPDVTAGTPAYTDDEIIEAVVVEEASEAAASPAEEAAALDPALVDHLVKGIEVAKATLEDEGENWLDGLNVRLGALGIDGFDPNTPLAESLSKLTEQQFRELEGELQGIADSQAEETVDGEAVEEEQEGGDPGADA